MPSTVPHCAFNIAIVLPGGLSLEIEDLDGSDEQEALETTHFALAANAADEAGGRTFIAQAFSKVEYTFTVHYDPDINPVGDTGTFSLTHTGSGGAILTGSGICTAYNPSFRVNELGLATMTVVYTGKVTITAAV